MGWKPFERRVESFTLDMSNGAQESRRSKSSRLPAFTAAARGRRGRGTGPNMAPHPLATELLICALNTLCGRYRQAGEISAHTGVLGPASKAARTACLALLRIRVISSSRAFAAWHPSSIAAFPAMAERFSRRATVKSSIDLSRWESGRCLPRPAEGIRALKDWILLVRRHYEPHVDSRTMYVA